MALRQEEPIFIKDMARCNFFNGKLILLSQAFTDGFYNTYRPFHSMAVVQGFIRLLVTLISQSKIKDTIQEALAYVCPIEPSPSQRCPLTPEVAS